MSYNNRIDQLSQVRELALEAAVVNAATGETHRGSAALYMLTQGRHSRSSRDTRTSSESRGQTLNSPLTTPASASQRNLDSVYLDTSRTADCNQLRLSLSKRQPNGQSQPASVTDAAHRVATPPPNAASYDSCATPADSAQADPAKLPQAPEGNAASVSELLTASEAPFPTKAVVRIIATQLLATAPSIVFAALTPYMYSALVGNYQSAGTISSIVSGVGMFLQVIFTPILSQVMDLYGRRTLAVFTAAKSLVNVAPLLVAGIVVCSSTQTVPQSSHDTAANSTLTNDQVIDLKLGQFLEGSSKTVVQFCFGLFWALNTLSSATASAQCVVAIGDICQSQNARAAALGMYSGFAYLLAAVAVVGAQVSLLVGSIVAVVLSFAAVACSVFLMPETVAMSGDSGGAILSAAAPSMPAKDFGQTDPYSPPNSPAASINNRLSSTTRRRGIYPPEIETSLPDESSSSAFVAAPATNNSTAINVSLIDESAPLKIQYNDSRRIRVCINPLKGFRLISKSRASLAGLGVLICFLLAEISASDTLVYYLAITLNFGPSDVSYIQMESSAVAMISSGILGPILSRHVSCHYLCMLCSVCVAAALIVLSFADSAVFIYAVYAPLTSFASLMIPALAAIITKDASSPEDVSLSMGTVMSFVALLQAGASFLVALVFKALNRDQLWITFLISAVFTIPMFGLSVYLGYVCKKDAKRDECEAQDQTTPNA